MNALIPKARRPKFELVIKVIDLNNVPLVTGQCYVKWYLHSSTTAEHHGRTPKMPIKDHCVTWDYSHTTSLRLTVDKGNQLTESPITFEIIQEYTSGSTRHDKITLGYVNLNLSEYVEGGDEGDDGGITRRYLMMESKINSTLKLGILMNQVDGEKNFKAPPLRTAPVFGGIAGIMAGEQGEHPDDLGHMPSISKSREARELQDMYRRTLAASWMCQAGVLPADQCIEDIFAGGDGWKSKDAPSHLEPPRESAVAGDQSYDQRDRYHQRQSSGGSMGSRLGSSDRLQAMTRIEVNGNPGEGRSRGTSHTRNKSKSELGQPFASHLRLGSASTTHSSMYVSRRPSGHRHQLGPNDGLHKRPMTNHMDSAVHDMSEDGESERGRSGWRDVKEVDEFEVREDLTAWRWPDTTVR